MPANRLRRVLGQTGTEYMLIISVAVIAVVGAAYVFVEPFGNGVDDLGNDVKEILGGQSIGGVGRGGPNGGPGSNTVNGGSPTNNPSPDGPGTDGLGAPASGDGGNRSYDGRTFSNTQDVAWDDRTNDPLRDILGPSTQDRLNGYPDMPVMTASLPGSGDSQLAQAAVPAARRVAVIRTEDDA